MPPTTPPAIAPTGVDFDEGDGEGEVLEVLELLEDKFLSRFRGLRPAVVGGQTEFWRMKMRSVVVRTCGRFFAEQDSLRRLSFT